MDAQLAGVDNDTIAKDYALTRVGREPWRAIIMARLAKEPMFAEDKEAACNMLDSRFVSPLFCRGMWSHKSNLYCCHLEAMRP